MNQPMKFALTMAFAIVWAVSAAAATLTVYAPNSFTGKYGPGAAVKQAFEQQCGCTLEWVALDDGVTLLNRIKLEGARSTADVVLGLDMNLIAEARATGLFAPHGQDSKTLTVPVAWSDDLFLPFDYGHFAVVYDTQKLAQPPRSLKELIEGDPAQKIVIQDPRTSTPGLGLMLWIKSVYGDRAGDAWAKLKPRVLTVTKGWSEAYGLFTKGEAPLVLSYTLSPAYHMIIEKTERYQAAAFAEGHYLQIEVAGKLKSAKEPQLADRFLGFMLTAGFQDKMPTGNWMLPAAKGAEPLPAVFDKLVKPVKTLLLAPDEVAAKRKEWTDEWLAAMSK